MSARPDLLDRAVREMTDPFERRAIMAAARSARSFWHPKIGRIRARYAQLLALEGLRARGKAA